MNEGSIGTMRGIGVGSRGRLQWAVVLRNTGFAVQIEGPDRRQIAATDSRSPQQTPVWTILATFSHQIVRWNVAPPSFQKT